MTMTINALFIKEVILKTTAGFSKYPCGALDKLPIKSILMGRLITADKNKMLRQP